MGKIEDLQQEAFKLHSKITSTAHIPTKRKLVAQEAKILQQIRVLELKAFPEKEKEASQKIDELFRSDKIVCVLTINGIRTEPDENLNVTLKFHPCQHELTMHIKELFHRYQAVCPNEQVLFSRWQGTLNPNAIIEKRYNCPKCIEAKQKKFKMFRRRSAKDIIGTASVVLKTI